MVLAECSPHVKSWVWRHTGQLYPDSEIEKARAARALADAAVEALAATQSSIVAAPVVGQSDAQAGKGAAPAVGQSDAQANKGGATRVFG